MLLARIRSSPLADGRGGPSLRGLPEADHAAGRVAHDAERSGFDGYAVAEHLRAERSRAAGRSRDVVHVDVGDPSGRHTIARSREAGQDALERPVGAGGRALFVALPAEELAVEGARPGGI